MNRLYIDYTIIKKLDKMVKAIDVCIYKGDWKQKKELEKNYFNIYDQLDIAHQEYIEHKKI